MKAKSSQLFHPRLFSRRVLLLTVMLATAFLIAGCNRGNSASNNTNAPVISGQPPTDLPMPPLNGKSLEQMGWNLSDGTRNSVSEFKGKVLILDFYATWCEPCRVSIPHLIDLQQRYQNEVKVVGLNVGGADDVDRVPAFAKEFKIQYTLGLPDDDLVNLLLANSDAIPQTFIFDGKGQLVRRFVGFGEMTSGQIDLAVEAALRSSAD